MLGAGKGGGDTALFVARLTQPGSEIMRLPMAGFLC
jgi:hypothetical protein